MAKSEQPESVSPRLKELQKIRRLSGDLYEGQVTLKDAINRLCEIRWIVEPLCAEQERAPAPPLVPPPALCKHCSEAIEWVQFATIRFNWRHIDSASFYCNGMNVAEPVVAPRPPQPDICAKCSKPLLWIDDGHFAHVFAADVEACPGKGEWPSPLVVGQRPQFPSQEWFTTTFPKCPHCGIPQSHGHLCLEGLGKLADALESWKFIPADPEAEAVHPAPPPWSVKAAEEIFALFKNASYFSTRNAEHRQQMLQGWAELIERWHFNSGCDWAAQQPTLSPQLSTREIADEIYGKVSTFLGEQLRFVTAQYIAETITKAGLAVVRKKGE